MRYFRIWVEEISSEGYNNPDIGWIAQFDPYRSVDNPNLVLLVRNEIEQKIWRETQRNRKRNPNLIFVRDEESLKKETAKVLEFLEPKIRLGLQAYKAGKYNDAKEIFYCIKGPAVNSIDKLLASFYGSLSMTRLERSPGHYGPAWDSRFEKNLNTVIKNAKELYEQFKGFPPEKNDVSLLRNVHDGVSEVCKLKKEKKPETETAFNKLKKLYNQLNLQVVIVQEKEQEKVAKLELVQCEEI